MRAPRTLHAISLCLILGCGVSAPLRPVPLIFDTDMGNDIDDALALAMLHALADQGRVELLAVTVSKDNPWAAPFVDVVNTFYGRPDLPIGVVRGGRTPGTGSFLRAVAGPRQEGRPVHPHDLRSGRDAPDAVSLLRQILAGRGDAEVVFVVVGFSTNLARLLASPGDDASPLPGRELVARKVRLLSMMAGGFRRPRQPEYNVIMDLRAARTVIAEWPTPIVLSGFEVGARILYPASSIEHDFGWARRHPVTEAYRHYLPMPYDRPCWDLTSVLVAVEPDAGWFGLSPSGALEIDRLGRTFLRPDPAGRHRHLTVTPDQARRARSRFIELVTARPRSARDS